MKFKNLILFFLFPFFSLADQPIMNMMPRWDGDMDADSCGVFE